MFSKPKILLKSWIIVWMMLMLRRWRDAAMILCTARWQWYYAMILTMILCTARWRLFADSQREVHQHLTCGEMGRPVASPVTHSVRIYLSCTNIHQFLVVVIMLLLMVADSSGILSLFRKINLRMWQVACLREYYIWCKSFKCRLWRKAMHIWQIYHILRLLLGIRSRCLFVFDALTFNDLSPLSTLLRLR